MSEDADPDDLEQRVQALEAAVRELRRELRPRRQFFGLPLPPRPEAIRSFTTDYAVPAAIASLEAQVRALEAFRATLRGLDRDDEPSERTERTRERAESLGREALGALDRALADLRDAVEAGRLPDTPETRRVLDDAEHLTSEIEAELRASRERERRARRSASDVEEELEILRDEFDGEGGDDPQTGSKR